jgi:hypothetical protein
LPRSVAPATAISSGAAVRQRYESEVVYKTGLWLRANWLAS